MGASTLFSILFALRLACITWQTQYTSNRRRPLVNDSTLLPTRTSGVGSSGVTWLSDRMSQQKRGKSHDETSCQTCCSTEASSFAVLSGTSLYPGPRWISNGVLNSTSRNLCCGFRSAKDAASMDAAAKACRRRHGAHGAPNLRRSTISMLLTGPDHGPHHRSTWPADYASKFDQAARRASPMFHVRWCHVCLHFIHRRVVVRIHTGLSVKVSRLNVLGWISGSKRRTGKRAFASTSLCAALRVLYKHLVTGSWQSRCVWQGKWPRTSKWSCRQFFPRSFSQPPRSCNEALCPLLHELQPPVLAAHPRSPLNAALLTCSLVHPRFSNADGKQGLPWLCVACSDPASPRFMQYVGSSMCQRPCQSRGRNTPTARICLLCEGLIVDPWCPCLPAVTQVVLGTFCARPWVGVPMLHADEDAYPCYRLVANELRASSLTAGMLFHWHNWNSALITALALVPDSVDDAHLKLSVHGRPSIGWSPIHEGRSEYRSRQRTCAIRTPLGSAGIAVVRKLQNMLHGFFDFSALLAIAMMMRFAGFCRAQAMLQHSTTQRCVDCETYRAPLHVGPAHRSEPQFRYHSRRSFADLTLRKSLPGPNSGGRTPLVDENSSTCRGPADTRVGTFAQTSHQAGCSRLK